MLRKPENNFLRAIYAGVQNFFSGPIAGLTNQPPVRDFRPGAPLLETKPNWSWSQLEPKKAKNRTGPDL